MNEYLTRKRSSGDFGKRETLPPSLQTKMNQSFGIDFSSVKLYRNDEMSGTGMQGLASGNRVILSREVDLNSKLGQAVLGHELSHIYAQSQGIGGGHSGLYDNAALERQADTEGRMAANGQPIFGDRSGMNMGAGMGGMGTLTPLSGGMSGNAGAPMQARRNKKGNDIGAKRLSNSRKTRDEVRKAELGESGNDVYADNYDRDEEELAENIDDPFNPEAGIMSHPSVPIQTNEEPQPGTVNVDGMEGFVNQHHLQRKKAQKYLKQRAMNSLYNAIYALSTGRLSEKALDKRAEKRFNKK